MFSQSAARNVDDTISSTCYTVTLLGADNILPAELRSWLASEVTFARRQNCGIRIIAVKRIWANELYTVGAVQFQDMSQHSCLLRR